MNMPIVLKVLGIPLVQKNDNVIKKIKTSSGKYRSFVGHSARLEAERTRIGIDMFAQYRKQGFIDPIDYLISAELTFYVLKWHEPDADNLPHIFFDAMQGIRIKGMKNALGKSLKAYSILTNDKLVRRILQEKIVEGDAKYYGEPRTEIRIEQYFN